MNSVPSSNKSISSAITIETAVKRRIPWGALILMAFMTGAIGYLLRLGGNLEGEEQSGYIPLPIQHVSNDVVVEGAGSVPLQTHPQITGNVAPSSGNIGYQQGSSDTSENSSGATAKGFRDWIGSLWTSDTPEPSDPTGIDTPSSPTASVRSNHLYPATSANSQVASTRQATFTAIREVPNEQMMQPGDDSVYLNDGAPGEEAGGALEDRP